MNRRDIIFGLGGAAVCPGGLAWANEPVRIGYLSLYENRRMLDALKRGLSDLGLAEGRDFVLDSRFAGGKAEELDRLAVELVGLSPRAVVANGAVPARAALRATGAIPIVMAPVGDAVRTGFVPRLSSSGSNVTGVSLYAAALTQKRLDLLKEALPQARRVGILMNAVNRSHSAYQIEAEEAARTLGLEMVPVSVRGLGDLATGVATLRQQGSDAMTAMPDAEFDVGRSQMVALAAQHRLPALYEHRAYAEAGGLMSYGPNVTEMSYRAATYVAKLLKGARPSDLPIEEPTRLELVLNMAAARSLGLTLAPSLLARADEVIE